MLITLNWDPSVDTIGADEAAFKNAVSYVADYFDRIITNSVSISINVGWTEITQDGVSTPVGQGSSLGGGGGYIYSYSDLKPTLQADENSPETTAAFGALPMADPSGGGGFVVPEQIATILGLPTFGTPATGAVGFGLPLMGTTYNYSTTDRAVGSETDFVGVVFHEMAHALGRVSYLGSGSLSQLDLFRFTAPGVLATTTSQTSYFSINNGTTPLVYFDSTGSDPADWISSGPHASTGDAFDAVNLAGHEDYLTTTDLNVMNLLGYSITPNLPKSDLLGNLISDVLIQNTAGAVVVGELGGDGHLAYTQVTGLGPEWSFGGTGDFLGDRKSDFVIENTVGAVVVGEVKGGATTFTQVGGLGPEWHFVGAGDVNGDGLADILIENTVGAVVMGTVTSGRLGYAQIGGLGPEWSFHGVGDFNGDGKADILIENTVGAVVVGEVISGNLVYTQVGGLGPEWSFVGVGDVNGDGKADILIENTSGAVVMGEVSGGHLVYTTIGGLGPEWRFVGTADFLGQGYDQVLIENTAGAVVLGDYYGGMLHYTTAGGLGHEWSFHQ